MTRVAATSIWFRRAEGRTAECTPVEFCVADRDDIPSETLDSGLVRRYAVDIWRALDEYVFAARRSAPNHGGYDKCDVVVVFGHGTRNVFPNPYATRYDMTGPFAPSMTGNLPDTPAGHLVREILFNAGLWRPANITDRQYGSLLEGLVGDADARHRRLVLAQTLDVPGLAEAYGRERLGPLGGGRA